MSVPWKAITTSPAYIEEESLPEETLLCEPSKLQSHAVTLLWNHWRQRQNDGEIGLDYTKARPEDMREKPREGKGKAKAKPQWENPGSPSPQPEASGSGHGHQRDKSPTPQPETPNPPVLSGSGKTPQPSPSASPERLDDSIPVRNKQRKKDRLLFLKSLCGNTEYVDMVKRVERIKVPKYFPRQRQP